MYKAQVRPKFELCVEAWRPYLKRNIDLLEKVQRRATRLIFADEIMPYEERLKCLHLTTSETRRIRSDLLEVFKIIKNLEDTNRDLYFKLSGTGLRGHSLKVFKLQARLDIRKYSFSNRVVDNRNALPQTLIDCNTLNNFKSKLDLYVHYRGFR